MLHTPAQRVASARHWLPMPSIALIIATLVCAASRAEAHGLSEASRQTMADGGILAYIWLGAEHMLTGYDHLLFLFGVLFFLTSFRDVLRFITAFTLGHCITLLGATLAGITANAYLIDAVIALSVVYKGFENLDGFEKRLGIRAPNLLAMVFIFGLIHGFGLSTRLQEITLGHEGLVSRILAFNVGVEFGQVAALTVMLALFAAWRSSKTFERFATAANVALVLAGIGLFGLQMTGYMTDAGHADHHTAVHEEDGEHGREHGTEHGHEHGSEHGHEQSAAEAMLQTLDAGIPGQDSGHDHGDEHDHQHGSGAKHSH